MHQLVRGALPLLSEGKSSAPQTIRAIRVIRG